MITLQQQQKVAEACIKACNIGSIEVVYDPAQGEGGALIIDGWLFIEQIAIKTKWLGGIMYVPGWRLYRIRTQNNYPHAPDDAWDETVWETKVFDDVVKHALIEYVRVMVDQREPTDEEVAEFDRTHALPEEF